ncbi:MAG: hypothetical protein AAB316_21330, partial [Bacteroidota bacterium]
MKTRLNLNFLLGMMLLPGCFLLAQQAIFFTNPSFEDYPGYAKTPGGWQNCAFNDASPPDIHPVPKGNFEVVQKPFHGETYVGLVVRDDATRESMGQKLAAHLQAGACYSFSVQLCRSKNLFSRNRSGELLNYNSPVVLRVWGGISPCGQKALLVESPPLAHLDWKKYFFQIIAPDSLTHISFEAFYVTGTDPAYNGNILLDNLTPLLPIDCQTLQPLVDTAQLIDPGYKHEKIMAQVFPEFGQNGWEFPKKPDLKSIEDLANWMEGQCETLAFEANQNSVEAFERWVWREIAASLRQFPDHRLWVVLSEMEEKEGFKRMKAIRQVLSNTRLAERQFT